MVFYSQTCTSSILNDSIDELDQSDNYNNLSNIVKV